MADAETRKEKREMAKPEGHRVLDTIFETGDFLEYNGSRYVKMSRIIRRRHNSPGLKSDVSLWLCIEATGRYPARTMIVPEFHK